MGKDCLRNSMGSENGNKLAGLIIRCFDKEDLSIISQMELERLNGPLGNNNLIMSYQNIRTWG